MSRPIMIIMLGICYIFCTTRNSVFYVVSGVQDGDIPHAGD
jgi:hypothetical protein